MFLEIPDILTPAETAHLIDLSRRCRFVDGRVTSPHSKVKNNLQIDQTDQAYLESSRLLATALQRSEAVRAFTFARTIAPPMLARYTAGMNYGPHSDAAFLPLPSGPLRSDLSCTVFLTAPGAYMGGELSVQLGTRAVLFKGAAGSAVVYPSNTLHEVRPVVSGERLVGLTFMESMIPDPVCRDLLHQLDEVAALEGFNMSWENRTRLQYVRNNLRRIWGEAE